MSIQLVQKLEEKVDQAVETIGMLRLELEEMSESQERLKTENTELKNRQLQWEQSLSSLLKKLSNTDLSGGQSSRDVSRNHFVESEVESEILHESEIFHEDEEMMA